MFQYRISALLIATFAVAMASWLLLVLPLEYYVIVMLCVHAIVPAFVVAGIIHFRGYRQHFSLAQRGSWLPCSFESLSITHLTSWMNCSRTLSLRESC